jgi:hypothetical protein
VLTTLGFLFRCYSDPSTLLFHALWREELCKLKVMDFRHARKGVPHLKVSGMPRQDALSAAASRHPWIDQRLSRHRRAWPRR